MSWKAQLGDIAKCENWVTGGKTCYLLSGLFLPTPFSSPSPLSPPHSSCCLSRSLSPVLHFCCHLPYRGPRHRLCECSGTWRSTAASQPWLRLPLFWQQLPVIWERVWTCTFSWEDKSAWGSQHTREQLGRCPRGKESSGEIFRSKARMLTGVTKATHCLTSCWMNLL